MDLKERIGSFIALGEILKSAINGKPGDREEELRNHMMEQHKINPWFTPENVRLAVSTMADELTEEKLLLWTSRYPELQKRRIPVTAGIIMAGNIPLVGFHDFLSVLITGNNVIVKPSSKDPSLIIMVSDLLCSLNHGFRDKIRFTDKILSGFDIIIATGSNNSSRYFEYYFGKYPHIIRKNRNSIAILDGSESKTDLEDLGLDIFSYFGLGCRNVSKLFIPEGYDINLFGDYWQEYSGVTDNIKYANNYLYNKALYQVNREDFHDTGYLILINNNGVFSPVSVVYYENYSSSSSPVKNIRSLETGIQTVVGKGHTPFGKSQQPYLWEYADGIDTIEFLLKNS